MEHFDILIIGGGAAGIAAAKAAMGVSVLLVDRKMELGGVLLQCRHHGFGKNKNGVEYTAELLAEFPEGSTLALNTTVLSVSKDRTALLSGREYGRKTIRFSQLILATGCREIPMGTLPIGGTRPKGIYTAGQMQEQMNLHGFVPEGPALILGSGDLGLIMAKQLVDAGLDVTLVEQKESCGGMLRNQRALENTAVKLICRNTIAEVCGQRHLDGCILSDGTYIPCRLLLIAVGLRPERELIAGLEDMDWIHLCGNCNIVHPMVENVVKEGRKAGILACEKIRGSL